MPKAAVSMPERTSPLAGRAAPSLIVLPPQDRISLRTRDPAAMAAAMGITLGITINRAVETGGVAALTLGPDEWLILAAEGKAAALLSLAGASPGSAVDVSHRTVAIGLAPPHAAMILNAFVALDLAPAAFPPGSATRTLLGKAEIVLWCTAPACFRIEVARSLAPYAWDCLVEAGREFA
jgi:heterotetrameric sarcosine oxidase gamma subunit